MRKSIYPVMLTEEERIFARGIVKAGKASVQLTLMPNKFKVSTVKGRVEICGANTTRP